VLKLNTSAMVAIQHLVEAGVQPCRTAAVYSRHTESVRAESINQATRIRRNIEYKSNDECEDYKLAVLVVPATAAGRSDTRPTML
jgi:hypothetical protein